MSAKHHDSGKKKSQIEITTLTGLAEKIVQIASSDGSPSEKEERIRQELQRGYLARHMNVDSVSRIEKNPKLHNLLLSGGAVEAAVVCADIRNSTGLMKDTATDEAFADFIADLTESAFRSIERTNGLYEKFTGDGFLCIFINEMCGGCAIRNALLFAQELHDAFPRHFEKHQRNFRNSHESGFGIGIDFGPVEIRRLQGRLTAISDVVVNAFRLSHTRAGTTLINNGAFFNLDIDRQLAEKTFIKKVHLNLPEKGLSQYVWQIQFSEDFQTLEPGGNKGNEQLEL